MISLISIYTAGILTILMAIFHTRFYKLFNWENEYSKLGAVNKKIFYTIHLALTLFFFAMGTFTLFYAQELSISNGMALGFNISMILFWLWRFVWQLVYFPKPGKNVMSLLFSLHFFLLFLGYLIPAIIILIEP